VGRPDCLSQSYAPGWVLSSDQGERSPVMTEEIFPRLFLSLQKLPSKIFLLTHGTWEPQGASSPFCHVRDVFVNSINPYDQLSLFEETSFSSSTRWHHNKRDCSSDITAK